VTPHPALSQALLTALLQTALPPLHLAQALQTLTVLPDPALALPTQNMLRQPLAQLAQALALQP
jgi:hypothetical protein